MRSGDHAPHHAHVQTIVLPRVRAGTLAILMVAAAACVAFVVSKMRGRNGNGATTKDPATSNTRILQHAQDHDALLRQASPAERPALHVALLFISKVRALLLEGGAAAGPADGDDLSVRALQEHGALLVNRTTGERPFVVERIVVDGQYDYVTRYSGDKDLLGVGVETASRRLNSALVALDLRDHHKSIFANTDPNPGGWRWTIVEHPWLDVRTGDGIMKRSVVYRLSASTYIGFGERTAAAEEGAAGVRTTTRPVPYVDVLLCLALVYFPFATIAFIYPGTLVVSDHHFFKNNVRWIMYALPIAMLVVFVGLVARHVQTVFDTRTGGVTNETIDKRIQMRRIVALTVTAMALSFAFFAVSQESVYIIPSMLLSVVYSLAILLDATGMRIGDGDGQQRNRLLAEHITSALLVCSMFALIWLFLLYLVRFSIAASQADG